MSNLESHSTKIEKLSPNKQTKAFEKCIRLSKEDS